jgi:hypothetical protein
MTYIIELINKSKTFLLYALLALTFLFGVFRNRPA